MANAIVLAGRVRRDATELRGLTACVVEDNGGVPFAVMTADESLRSALRSLVSGDMAIFSGHMTYGSGGEMIVLISSVEKLEREGGSNNE